MRARGWPERRHDYFGLLGSLHIRCTPIMRVGPGSICDKKNTGGRCTVEISCDADTMQPVMAQPIQQQQPPMQIMHVQVPQGMEGGHMLQVQTPAGLMQVQVPNGLHAGQVFHRCRCRRPSGSR